ncbi:P60-like protein [Mytilinidion resinicola]|uniref:Ribosome biogenesis protein NOP53 n=1 Tax=Mytilinidion resinicola TaxID=574789 RepID=A0A6A6Z7F4_9PEZI|nr:P60-like protein [Mytilinidion resinicola]KAF2816234.1 P60-like protein [Mytilinidion resinicola]
MASSVSAPAQHKQPSRKGKKAWRKHVDTTEIEQGLDDVRDEVILGGVISEKPSSELFSLDTTGSAEIQKTYKTGKPLKADEIIAARSAIPAVSMRKRPAPRTTDGIIAPEGKKPRISNKEYDRLRAIAYGGDQVQKDVVRLEGATHDPWAAEEKVQDPKFSFLEEKKAKREPVTLKRAPVSLVASGKAVPAVKKPEAGKSYNPNFEDWKGVLKREGDKEVEAEKKRLQKAEIERERQERIMAIAAEPDLVSDDGESAWESEWEGFQSEVEEDLLKKKRPERKTQPERNKMKRRKEAERLALHEAKSRERDRQHAQIKAVAKAVKVQEKAKEAAQALVVVGEDDSSDEGDEVLRRKSLGKARIPEAPLEVVLSDELQDSLRLLKPEGNLLKDRFRSMMVRGRIESRRPIAFHKQRKMKATEKWSYKDWKLPQ